MDTSTGRFISMDTYQGSTADPISLHKYLYANSNPVMYTDPSGYMSLLGEIAVTACIDVLISGFISGSVSMGMNILNALTAAKHAQQEFKFGSEQIMAFIEGFLVGSLLGGIGMLAHSLKLGIVFLAFGIAGIASFSASLKEGVDAWKNDDYLLSLIYFGLAGFSLWGANSSFNMAGNFTKTGTTVNTTKNASTDTKNAVLDVDDGWQHWNDYEHVEVGDKTYAKVNGRNYSHHAVDRMQPGGRRYKLGGNIYQAGGDNGRGVSPHMVEYVIGTSVPSVQSNGNIAYTNGTVTVITNSNGDVVTILTK